MAFVEKYVEKQLNDLRAWCRKDKIGYLWVWKNRLFHNLWKSIWKTFSDKEIRPFFKSERSEKFGLKSDFG